MSLHPDKQSLTEDEYKAFHAGLSGMYSYLEQVTNMPEVMIYPAGGRDIYPLLFMKIMSKLVILDAMPFARDISSERKRRLLRRFEPKVYSYELKLRKEILSIQENKYKSLSTILKDFTDEEKRMFHVSLVVKAKSDLKEQFTIGYQKLPSSYAITSKDDRVEHMLGALYLVGIDMDTPEALDMVKIGKIDGDFHITFALQGKEKRLIYRNKRIEIDRNGQGEIAGVVKDLVKRFRNSKTVGFIKADVFDFADFVIRAMQPDKIIITPRRGDMKRSNEYLERIYALESIPNVPSDISELTLGYGMFKDIVIGVLKNLQRRG